MKNFNPYNKPCKPIEPKEFIEKFDKIQTDIINNYDSVEIPSGAKTAYIESSCDDYGNHDIEITFFGEKRTIKNPNYNEQMLKHKAKLEQYKIGLAKWTKQKKEYDKEQNRKAKEELKMYNELKEEFENE